MKYILDLDTGIDDTFALLYLLSNNKDLIGVTTTFGNVTVDQASKNTLDLLDLYKYDIPVYQGEKGVYKSNKTYKPESLMYRIHGDNGIGNIKLPKSKRKVEDKKAVDFIIESANKYGKDLTLICEATLTNLALAMDKDLKAVKKIGNIVLMGGAVSVEGNTNKYAEANIYKDYKAAKRVFEGGIHLTIVGLDVTLKTTLMADNFKVWNNHSSKQAKVAYKMLSYYCQNEFDGCKYAAMHDPLAVEVAINPSIIKYALPMNLTVDTTKTPGRTIGDRDKIYDKKMHDVLFDVYSKKFTNSFVNKINKFLDKYE